MSQSPTRVSRAAAASVRNLDALAHGRVATWKLAIPPLGVAYGDIGTSPLYPMKECFQGDHAVAPNAANVLGVLSLIFYSLTFVVTIKYLMFILRADNHGEGGILALLALVPKKVATKGKVAGPGFIVLLVIFGAGLLFRDGGVKPAPPGRLAMGGRPVARDG